MNSGYTLWGKFTAISNNNGRIYSKESMYKAVRDFLQQLKTKQRKEKLEKLNKLNENL